MSAPSAIRHIGLSLGRIDHWHDGLGEFSRQLGLALAARAHELRGQHGLQLSFHLPARWHGVFGDQVGYLATHTTQRWLHVRPVRFALWHTLHQHNRLRAPLGTQRHVETVHDLNFLHTKSAAKIERYRARTRLRLLSRDAVIAITHHVAADIQRELGPLPHAPVVIHNGATDLTGVAQQAVDGIDPASGYLLHISRMAPSKNIQSLLDLAASWPDQAFVLAGATSPYTAEVRQQVTQRGLHNVTIRLDLDEGAKAWLYAHARGFLFPSFTEGFGLPPIEAMHFGVPVFLSRLTSLPEVGGDVADYFDDFAPATMRSVVDAGLRRAEHPAHRTALRQRAKSFSWTACAEACVALYLRTLAPTR
ncbi:glycosyltransferase family 4 protein [Sphaerotilus mobilis]|uniref:Glycosyltransferase involved in cell wall biosynthesis n=1 Tax=Sphaerotilus mobilis TaxID=47994 RepID=A0A4Q7LCW5_9BURK|nr:glycosyltransferase family 1 protein [Sphaerotilus mobilis]RZS47550.1 glycosyltransferase involved in cell wall biosynthesis [Sphaerotilus mobilis]